MLTLPRLVAVLLLSSAIAVAGHFIFSHFYVDAIEVHKIWDVLNWIMAVGVLYSLAYNFMRRRAANAGPASRSDLGASLAFYITALLALWYFWAWFSELTTGTEDAENVARSITWILVDGLYPLVTGSVACHLWSSDDR